MTLSADQRGALEMLVEGRCCTGETMLAHGFNVDMLAGLVRDGLATARREPVRVEGRMVKIARLRNERWPERNRRLIRRPRSPITSRPAAARYSG